ncbi:YfiR family protein [Puniceicoccaceae bacterium K14]|nr:YfiR family protein [Puniceicoccaceae bacterium K14]
MATLIHRFLASSLLLSGLLIISSLSAQTLQIDSLKANYLEGFIDFVWRDGKELPTPTHVGVVGDSDMASLLVNLSKSSSNKRAIIVSQIAMEDFIHASTCGYDLIFVGSGHKKNWPQFFEQTSTCRALIVGEEKGFIKAGGTIELIVLKNRLRFCVDNSKLNEQGIKLSSKLLELAIEQP